MHMHMDVELKLTYKVYSFVLQVTKDTMHTVGTLRNVATTQAAMAEMASMKPTPRGNRQTETGIRYRENDNVLWNLEDFLKFNPYRLV